MKKILLFAALSIAGCKDDGRTYVGEHNYYTMEQSEIRKADFATFQQRDFPRYFIHRAKEWPREDLNDASSYDLPRVQFTWANLSNDQGYGPVPMYDEYEGRVKVWSMKTDGTDLRLVTDLPYLGKASSTRYKTSRSPNNRYVALNSGPDIHLYDLKEQKLIDLPHRLAGIPGFLWSEDSSYVYYRTGKVGRVVYKWDIAKGEAEKTDLHITDTGMIKDGKRYKVTEVFTVVYDEKTGEKLQSARWGENLKPQDARADVTAISPEGDVSWGANMSAGVFKMDVTANREVPTSSPMQFAIGLNSRFALVNKHMTRMRVLDSKTKQAWDWDPLAYSRTLDPAIVYNLSANQGNWFKEAN
ncbi:Tricorn protease N-terminal domain-containing protein [Vibrio jasicida]|uniref:hypothetical protein n=1 Tax=Vibrio jasicida TaxID=766224 RepID=UPI000CF56C6C|nr:hypothetical protein [Vibrio jasicida]PQJ69808.1 Tricorn protease N-terminal domain-containing protein [Vibrio jasicida]